MVGTALNDFFHFIIVTYSNVSFIFHIFSLSVKVLMHNLSG